MRTCLRSWRAGPTTAEYKTISGVNGPLVILDNVKLHRAHMPAQLARIPERSVALRARVIFALLVHRRTCFLRSVTFPVL
jgi:hypothetical protein